jgi:HK97 family phage portal protein
MDELEIDHKTLREYESTVKSLNPVTNDYDYASGFWDPELKAMMDLWTLKGLFYSEEWVYILVDRIASKIAAIPMRVMKESIVDGQVVREPAMQHPFQKRLDNPNDQESYYQFMYSVVADHSITGNSIVWNAPTMQKLIRIPAELVQMHFNHQTKELVSYFVYRSADEEAYHYQQKTEFPKSEIIHIRRPNPSSMYWGLSPFVPGKSSVLFNRYTTEYLNNFYVKGAQPGLVFSLANEANEKTALRMLKSMELAHTGRKNQRRNMILPKGVTHSTVEHRIADQDLRNHVLTNRETIINLMQVPKHELSIAESGSLGSEEYKVALKNFWMGPLRSIMQSIEWSMWSHFKNELGSGYVLEFDLSDVEVLRDDDLKKADLATKMLSTHTVNEIRQKLYNDDPIQGGDTLQSAQQQSFFSQFSAPAPLPAPIEPSPLSEEEKEPLETLELDTIQTQNVEKIEQLKASNKEWWQRREQMASEDVGEKEPKLVDLVMDLFADQAEEALKALKSHAREKAADVPSKARLRKAIRDGLNKFEAQWLDNYTEALISSVDVGYNTALELPFNLPNKQEIEASKLRNANKRLAILEERGLETFAYMTRTTTEKIMREVTMGLANNLTVQEIAKNIGQVMTDEDFTIGRAMTIARTEVLTASSVGQAAAMQDAAEVIPGLKKVWLNAGDERVRGNPGGLYAKSQADHWVLNGEMRGHDEKFSNGLMYPRDLSGPPEETIQCRCTLIMAPPDEVDSLGLQNIPDISGTERNP